jgi:hypothetical protein
MKKKWYWSNFFIKISSAALWVWASATILVFIVCILSLKYNEDHGWIKYIVLGWIIVSGLFVGGKVLVDAIAEAVKKAEIKANLGGK